MITLCNRHLGAARRHPRAVIALAAMLAGCAAPPGIGPEDRRMPVDVTAVPWRSLGMVVSDVGGRCTGALVASRAVLTAAHCLYDPRTLQLLDARRIEFFLAAHPGGHSGRARGVAIIAAPGFSISPGMRPDPAAAPNADWALLVLDASIADAERALTLAAGYFRPNTPIVLGGYQADSGGQLVADTSCAVLGYGRDAAGRIMMRHSCAATRGASGGPLLTTASTGAWVIAGVGSLAGNDAGGWAVPTLAIAETVRNARIR